MMLCEITKRSVPEHCGLVMDRDVNAAINIKNYGLKSGQGMPVEPLELPSMDGTMKEELKQDKDAE